MSFPSRLSSFRHANNSGKTQNLPFSINTMIELQFVTTTSDNTGTILSQSTPRQIPLLPDVRVIFLSSIVVLTPSVVPLLHSVWWDAGLQIMKIVLMPYFFFIFLRPNLPQHPILENHILFLLLMSTISNTGSMDKPFEWSEFDLTYFQEHNIGIAVMLTHTPDSIRKQYSSFHTLHFAMLHHCIDSRFAHIRLQKETTLWSWSE